VLITSINHIKSSTAVQRIFWRCGSFIFSRPFSENKVMDRRIHSSSSFSDSSSLPKDETRTFCLILPLCFAFASVAYFVSLLTFRPIGPGAGCSFAVAWGGISAQCARLVGLIILILELRPLGLPRWEYALFWTWLSIGSVLVFLTNAVTIGTTRLVQQLDVSLCYKIHFLPTSLISSLIYLSVEVYVAARAISLIAPPFLKVHHRFGGLRDSKVLKAISLIVFELLTLVPAARFTNILGDFVPFSIGSVLVLVTFNCPVVEPETSDLVASSCMSRISRRSGCPSLVIAINSHMPHPYATMSLNTLENGEWCNTRTVDSDSEYARSVAVARVASRRSHRSGKMIRVPPLPLSAPLASDVERAKMYETCQLQVARPILPFQVSYAERFEREVESDVGGLSARPHLDISTEPTQQSSPRPVSEYCKSPNSVFYGSDIIRMDSNRRTKDKTKRHISTDCSVISYSPRGSPTSPHTPSFKRYSFASLSAPLAPPNEDLSIVYEDVFAAKSSASRQSRRTTRWPTFDEQHFRAAGLVNNLQSRPFSGTLSSLPPLPLSSGRQKLRGPRPPPATERSPLMPHRP